MYEKYDADRSGGISVKELQAGFKGVLHPDACLQ
jgi:hypothetical protein